MIPEGGFEGKGCLLFIRLPDCLLLAKELQLKQFEILVISKDITGSIKKNRERQTRFDSMYDNVEFIPSLVPRNGLMEYVYMSNADGDARFEEGYNGQLVDNDAFKDLVCIVDMVVNDNVPVMMVCSATEYKLNRIDYLRAFITSYFDLLTYDIDDLLDPNVDVTIKGDEESTKELLTYYKSELSEGLSEEEFFNHLTDSMMDKYKSILMKKSVEELRELAVNRGIYVKRKSTKDEMVETILRKYSQ